MELRKNNLIVLSSMVLFFIGFLFLAYEKAMLFLFPSYKKICNITYKDVGKKVFVQGRLFDKDLIKEYLVFKIKDECSLKGIAFEKEIWKKLVYAKASGVECLIKKYRGSLECVVQRVLYVE